MTQHKQATEEQSVNNNLIFDRSGIYVPQVCEKVTLWRRDTTGDPFMGVYVPTPDNARRFASVFVVDSTGLVDYLAAQPAEMAA